MGWTTMDLTFSMLCSSTIRLAVSLQSKLARILILRLEAPHTPAEGEALMDSTDESRRIGEPEGYILLWLPFTCLPTAIGWRL